jgi:hypothetical protein
VSADAVGISKDEFESKKLPIKNSEVPIKTKAAKRIYLFVNVFFSFIGFTSTFSIKQRLKQHIRLSRQIY